MATVVAGYDGPVLPLEEIAEVAEEVADEQRAVADEARRMQARVDRGDSWSSILAEEPHPGLMARMRQSSRRLAGATSALASTLAHGLAREGRSRREIGRSLGVTHQRASALLRPGSTDDT